MNKLKLFLHVVGIVECTLTRTPIYRDTNTVCNNDSLGMKSIKTSFGQDFIIQ